MASSIGAKGSAPEFSRVAPGLAHSQSWACAMQRGLSVAFAGALDTSVRSSHVDRH